MSIPAPSIEYGQLFPMLIVFAVAVTGVVIEAVSPRRHRHAAQLTLSIGGLSAALVGVIALAGNRGAAAVGAVAVDGPALFLQGTILLIALCAVLLIAERRSDGALVAFTPQASSVPGSGEEATAIKRGVAQTEVFPLTMFAVGGMMLFAAANDLLTMFVALEVFSLPLYVMCGLARRRRSLSQEASLKYFLLGAFSSAFFLYGAAMLYGYAGTLNLGGIADAVTAGSGSTSLALTGVGMLAVGVLFKVGAVPFHTWIPDVYQGAPTPITAFMAAVTKIAAFGAMLRIFYVALPALRDEWRPVLWGISALTMVAGAVMAVSQTDVKRLLGYSAVAQAGFILIGVVTASASGLTGSLFYLVAYGFSALGAFAIVGVVRGAAGDEATAMASWAGLGRRSPVVAAAFSLFLLVFAGIPLTSGFAAKFAVFTAAGAGGAATLVIVGVLASAIAAFVYARLILVMFFADSPADAARVAMPGVSTRAAILTAVVASVAFGVAPEPLLELASRAGDFLH